MREITVYALGKINLGLDIVGRRDDGYHLVDMVMQTVKLSDAITIRTNEKRSINLTCTKSFVPTDERNLAYQAAKLLMDTYPDRVGGVDIHIKKIIPVAAGMAGGSTDAAAVLYGLNRLFDLGLKKSYLMRMSLELGADVPFCLFRGTARSEGIGERLTRLKPIPSCMFLIAKPALSIVTKDAYAAYDACDVPSHPDIEGLIAAINAGDLQGMAQRMGNVLEDVVMPKHREISDIKKAMLEAGALGAMMTGSGPTVFGVFDSDKYVRRAYDVISKKGLARGLYICGAYLI